MYLGSVALITYGYCSALLEWEWFCYPFFHGHSKKERMLFLDRWALQ